MLGMCAGMQVMAGLLSQKQGFLCGNLNNISDIDHKTRPSKSAAHSVKISGGSKLYDALQADETYVNSRHLVGVFAKSLDNTDIDVVAVAPDGIAEAIEIRGYNFAMGIQFHPEILASQDENMQNIFNIFVDAAEKYKKSKAEKKANAAI